MSRKDAKPAASTTFALPALFAEASGAFGELMKGFRIYRGVSEYRGTLFWGPYTKDPMI